MLDLLARQAADLIEREQAETSRRASEERYRILFDLGPVAIYSCDASGVIRDFNRRAAELWGREPKPGDTDQRFCGSYKMHRADGSFMPHDQCPMAEVLSGKITEARDMEVQIERPDGSWITVIVNIRVLTNEAGEITGAINCFVDISERQRAQEEVRQAGERFRFMAGSMPQKIFTATPNGEVDYFNRQWMEFAGLSFEQIKDWGWSRLIHPDDVEENIQRWRHSIDTGEPFQFVHRLRRADGVYRWHLSRAHAMSKADRKISMWIGSNTDIQDQKEAEEHLRQTQKLESLGILAGGIAHDFNNLLVGILGNASLAVEMLDAANPVQPLLKDVMGASERAAALTQQMLAYSGRGTFIVRPIDISELIRGLVPLLRSSISRTIELRLDLVEDLLPIEGDESQIYQVIMNLVINGAEAIENLGTVTVRAHQQNLSAAVLRALGANAEIGPGLYVCVEVEDTGSGMDEATKAKIFDPFFTTKFTGRGLGLASVSGIVRGHKGFIRVNSALGKGTTFRVLLPAKGAKPAETTAATDPVDTPTGSGLVLIVDDEAMVRRAAKASLERYGYSVRLAENGLEAVKVFATIPDRIALVLLDMTMPLMSGEETLVQLAAIKPDVRVILSSGFNEIEAASRFKGQSLAGFLQKPYTSAALAQKVKEVLETRQCG